jgi:hypothetical protein
VSVICRRLSQVGENHLNPSYSNQRVYSLWDSDPALDVLGLELIKQTRDLPIKPTVHVERI